MTTTTFDPSSSQPSPEQQVAEAVALAQGEKLQQAANEDRDRRTSQVNDEQENVSLIGGKFKSQQDLLDAYQELERRQGANTPEDEEEPSEEQPEATQDDVEDSDTDSEAVNYMTELGSEYDKTGTISDDAIERLSQMDQKDLIKSYLSYYQKSAASAQQVQLQESAISDIKASIGGDDAYTEMITWASNSLPSSEVDQFNQVTATGNPVAIKFAVEALNNRYRGDVGYEAPLVSGGRGSSGVKPYRSQAELARDISNPLYKNDPAFRQDVEERLSRSKDLL